VQAAAVALVPEPLATSPTALADALAALPPEAAEALLQTIEARP
jgi:hypothetical protein